MALPLVMYDVTATIGMAPASRGPSHPLRLARCTGLGVRAQRQTPPVRGSVGSLRMVVPQCVDLSNRVNVRDSLWVTRKFQVDFAAFRTGGPGKMCQDFFKASFPDHVLET
jgi:hypothetical protein